MFHTWMKTLLHCGFYWTHVNQMTYEPMPSAQAQSVRVKEKIFFGFVVPIVAILQEVRLNIYFILISESSPYVLSYRLIYSWENIVGYFSNVLIEILVINVWKQSFAKLPIPKLSIHNSAAFYLWQKVSQRFAWKSHFLTLYTLVLRSEIPSGIWASHCGSKQQ